MQCGARPKLKGEQLKGEQMKLFFNILNYAVFGILVALSVFMAFQPETLVLGQVLAAVFAVIGVSLWRVINTTAEERAAMDAKLERERDKGGVHAFWWVFWLIAFFPALIVVAIIHNGRKTRAAIREVKQAD